MIAFIVKSNFRLIARNKVTSFVKIVGLASGTAIFLLTIQFCLLELRYDKQHPHADRIFRYVHRVNSPDGIESFAFTSATTGPALKERFPEVESFARIFITEVSLRNPLSDAAFYEKKFAFADESFLELFHFPLNGGVSGVDMLKEPMSLILTPSSALKYFGTTDPVGKSLTLNGQLEFVVKGVLENDVEQTHFKFDFIASFVSLTSISNHPIVSQQIPASLNLEHKGFSTFYTYLRLSSKDAAEGLIAKFPAFIEAFRGTGRSQRLIPTLQGVESIHLSSNLQYEIDQNGSLKSIYVFIFIGLLTLLIACINYINTLTAEFLSRAPGVGLKKILGIKRSTLLLGHFTETCILSIISLGTGYLLAWLISPLFNHIVNRTIDLFSMEVLYLLLGILVLIVVVAGIYPAIKITQANELQAFKGSIVGKSSGLNLREVLVSFQLLISFCLVSISLLIFYQLDYLNSKDMGFDPEQVIVLNASAVDPQQRVTFKNSLTSDKNIHHVGMCSLPPGESLFTYGLSFPEHGIDEDRRIVFCQSYVDSEYLQALGLKIDRGRFFSAESPADSDAYLVVNQAAVKALADSALTTTFKYKDAFRNKEVDKFIAGVLGDFNFASLHQEIRPLMLEYNPRLCRYILVRFDTRQVQPVLRSLQQRWKENHPSIPFDYYFLQERFRSLYDNDQRQKKLITMIAVVSICLAALGIFGSTLFMVGQKTKQIGIRKIMGSGRWQLLMLLLKPTFMLVAASSAIGVPIALTLGNSWLSQYPYRINFPLMLFIVAFVLMAVIVTATISYQCYKLTRINPIDVLRKLAG